MRKIKNFMISIFTYMFFSSVSMQDYTEGDYVFAFYKIDNKVEIIVNDSLVFSSGIIDNNPDFVGGYKVYIGNNLTPKKDEVIVRLFNGREPYTEGQGDVHWEVEYSILKKSKEIEFMWNSRDDSKVGMVFEETYYF